MRRMKKLPWILAALIIALHLTYCILLLAQTYLFQILPYAPEDTLYLQIRYLGTQMRHLLAGTGLTSHFIVAISLWSLVHYGWKTTYLSMGSSVVAVIPLSYGFGLLAARLLNHVKVAPMNFIEIPWISAQYFVVLQIPVWFLFGIVRQILREANKE